MSRGRQPLTSNLLKLARSRSANQKQRPELNFCTRASASSSTATLILCFLSLPAPLTSEEQRLSPTSTSTEETTFCKEGKKKNLVAGSKLLIKLAFFLLSFECFELSLGQIPLCMFYRVSDLWGRYQDFIFGCSATDGDQKSGVRSRDPGDTMAVDPSETI